LYYGAWQRPSKTLSNHIEAGLENKEAIAEQLGQMPIAIIGKE
jgi:hypothetical protein